MHSRTSAPAVIAIGAQKHFDVPRYVHPWLGIIICTYLSSGGVTRLTAILVGRPLKRAAEVWSCLWISFLCHIPLCLPCGRLRKGPEVRETTEQTHRERKRERGRVARGKSSSHMKNDSHRMQTRLAPATARPEVEVVSFQNGASGFD